MNVLFEPVGSRSCWILRPRIWPGGACTLCVTPATCGCWESPTLTVSGRTSASTAHSITEQTTWNNNHRIHRITSALRVEIDSFDFVWIDLIRFDYSDAQRTSHDVLLPNPEPPRGIYLDPILRHGRVQLEERRRAEHRLRQLRPQVTSVAVWNGPMRCKNDARIATVKRKWPIWWWIRASSSRPEAPATWKRPDSKWTRSSRTRWSTLRTGPVPNRSRWRTPPLRAGRHRRWRWWRRNWGCLRRKTIRSSDRRGTRDITAPSSANTIS